MHRPERSGRHSSGKAQEPARTRTPPRGRDGEAAVHPSSPRPPGKVDIFHFAKAQLADEYDAAQERGEVHGHGGNRGNQHAKLACGEVATVGQIGLTYQQVHEGRQLRDAEKADPGIIARTLNERVERGEEPSKKALRAAVVNATQSAFEKPLRGHGQRRMRVAAAAMVMRVSATAVSCS